ncbi:MAG: bifunctional (p)ppGpp synthetase/guanosine-3',5'-bis(diphosphate) 3'-pyrophosphohydrolase [Acidobacteria bacterium]|nr:bifunctional (p)ppGpp synthetase/guanosine-3',5'-bis(diphosphate) 3'-pyrophosphohydrolase [Acidobacteriota bacterium]
MPPGSTEAPAAPDGVTGTAAQVEELFRELEAALLQSRPREDLSLLRQAYSFAASAHDGQWRDSGEPYIVHPLHAALILAGMNMDLVSLQTALLHDVVEDTSATLDELRRQFGEEVARCVDGVTKLGRLKFYSREEQQAESVRKMLLAMVDDVRVVIVKLADRLHNMRTLGFLKDPDRRRRVAQETVEIYAPIAHRLGMGRIRGELEDLAFLHLEPEAHAEIIRAMDSRRQASAEFLRQIQQTIEAILRQESIPARVEGRVKRTYSVHQKMRRQRIPIEQVYDLLAVRIVTGSVRECYAALGVIHHQWHPIPGRFKDFIAMPRPNLYQSLHTSVVGPGGQGFEVQIRTEDMHRVAEQGIAAHWKYKEGKQGEGRDDQRVVWLRSLLEWMQEMRDPGDFMSTLKVDLYREEVYTFTPRGKVIVLPREATPIDFAYSIHTQVGHSCVGAKVNGRIVPLKYALRNGDVVEILTQPGHLPSKDWLALVRTSRARQKIKAVINAAERARAIDLGQKLLEREARRLGVQLARISRENLEEVVSEYGFAKSDDLYAALGYGRFSPRKILQKVSPGADETPAEAAARPAAPPVSAAAPPPGDLVLRVKGIDDLLVYRAKCCNPILGEAIVGYITRGKGVAVHAVSCPNVQNLIYEAERRIEVEWGRGAGQPFPVKFVIHMDDRPGMLNDLTKILSDENSNIRSLDARQDSSWGGAAVVDMTVEVHDNKQLQRLVAAMRRVSGVHEVQRV